MTSWASVQAFHELSLGSSVGRAELELNLAKLGEPWVKLKLKYKLTTQASSLASPGSARLEYTPTCQIRRAWIKVIVMSLHAEI